MGRRAADTTNPVPALGVPLTGGRVILSQKWGPLCSVGVQTSPGLRTHPSLKRRSQPMGASRGVSVAVETMSLDRAKPVVREAFQNCIGNAMEDDASQDGDIYCQIKSIRTKPSQSGGGGNLKRNPRYANGSIIAPELVGGVCSEGAETGEAVCQNQAKKQDHRRVQSLRGEKPRSAVHCGTVSSYATPPRPCRMMTSPRLCSTCGRRQSQAPPCMAPACRKRAVNQIQASMTLPTPPRKDLPRLRKQHSSDASQSTRIDSNCPSAQLPKNDTTTQETQTQINDSCTQLVQNSLCKKSSITKQLSKKQSKLKSSQHTQTYNTQSGTSINKHQTTEQTENQRTPKNQTEDSVNKQTQSSVHVATKPPPPVLSIASESKATPPLPPKNDSHPKPAEVTTKPATPKTQHRSEAKTTPQTPPPDRDAKTEMDCENRPCSSEPRPLTKEKAGPEIPQCNGVPAALHGLLQNVEENLLSNQEKIKVLLNVIQDLERSKAMSEGRCSYRTGQDINNCSTCQKTACIIYSVEHDFRLQEGRFQSVLEALDVGVEYDVPAPVTKPAPCRPTTKTRVKKLRKKCFWWL